MTIDELRATLASSEPPAHLPRTLIAMWHDAKGNWDRAHAVAQDIDDDTGAWIHAYLHRKEGDLANAAYWYRRAGRRPAHGEPDAEWATIVRNYLRGDEMKLPRKGSVLSPES